MDFRLIDIIPSLIVWAIGLFLCLIVGSGRKVSQRLIFAIYAWHSIFALAYIGYIAKFGGDALLYYTSATNDFLEFKLGTDFVVVLTSLPAGLGLTFVPISLCFNAVGSLGIIFLAAAFNEVTYPSRTQERLKLCCLFLPSLSFWTAGLGKDSLSMLCTGIFLYGLIRVEQRLILVAIATSLMFLVRPHIASLMVVSLGLGAIWQARISGGVRFTTGLIGVVAAFVAVPLALVYATGSDTLTNVDDYIGGRQLQNLEGGSSVDIANMNPVLRVVTYLYRPFPFEIRSFTQALSSLDNIFLMFLTVVLVRALRNVGFWNNFRSKPAVYLYVLMTWLVLSQVTANLGIAARQKWMFVPALMLITLAASSQSLLVGKLRSRLQF